MYRLCLSSPRLTDDRLAQLLSQSAIGHNSILVQVDEFQETVRRWIRAVDGDDASSRGVSAGGFCECLQGSTAMSRGVVVLTGTNEITCNDVRRRLPAVFRRIHADASLGWMSQADICSFFNGFLLRFVPGWEQATQMLMAKGSPWSGAREISVDMLKQYLMHQITKASCLGIGVLLPSPSGQLGEVELHVSDQDRAAFMELICDPEAATKFLGEYAPVHVCAAIHVESTD